MIMAQLITQTNTHADFVKQEQELINVSKEVLLANGIDLKTYEWELRSGLPSTVERVQAAARQERIKLACKALQPAARTVDGLGELIGMVDARIYHRWEEAEPGFWSDKNNVDKFLKDNPELRPK